MINRQENVTVNEGTADQEFTAGNSDGGPAVYENVVNVKTLEKCFNERFDREKGNIVGTVEDKIQNAILTAIDKIITPKIELALGQKTCLLDGMRPVSWRIQNVRKT